ncbi:TPA: antiviral RADAR system adenosine deaminase RdrB [Proteus mirabilis]|nr:hypothetical protein [Proteus mirabilis]
MYIQDPKWLIPIVYLSSDRFLNYNLTDNNLVDKNHDIVIKNAIRDYHHHFGENLRNEDIDNLYIFWHRNKYNFNFKDCLSKLSFEFLVWKGSKFEVKYEKLETWLMLCSLLDPIWIIAYSYKNLLEKNIINISELFTIIESQCPFALYKDDNFIYSDNHVHLNGHGYISLSTLDLITDYNSVNKNSNIKWTYKKEYSLIESKPEIKDNLPLLIHSLTNNLLNQIYKKRIKHENIDILKIEESVIDLLNSKRDNEALFSLIKINSPSSRNQLILNNIFKDNIEQKSKWLLFCISLILDNESNNDTYNRFLNNFIITTNILRNYIIVSGVGLGQFVQHFGLGIRYYLTDKSKVDNILYDSSLSTNREFRVSPNHIIKGKNLIKSITPFLDKKIIENVHFVVHFSRKVNKKDNKYNKLYLNSRNNLVKEINKITSFFTSANNASFSHKNHIEEPEIKLDLRKFIRGFDVAGNENDLPIEVFSPALRLLRSGLYRSTNEFAPRIARPFLTIHAGEDYGHLLSGLRSIDEAVEFCFLEENDRIGHGLALGIDVKLWAKRQRRIYLPISEYLDNLVWCYHQAVKIAQLTTYFSSILSLLKEKIDYWCTKIYHKSYTPNELYRAWLLRRNWPHYRNKENDTVSSKYWVPDLDVINENEILMEIWQTYLQQDDYPNENIKNRIITINCLPNHNLERLSLDHEFYDSISNEELNLYEAIQDFLMIKLNRKGIIIESCPTSNIYIGRFKKYHEHPIFRWNPPNPEWLEVNSKYNRYGLRTGPMSVCINTDDCVLMPTTIANEHRIIKETAIHCFDINTLMADIWIHSIRKKGNDIFKENHLPIFI